MMALHTTSEFNKVTAERDRAKIDKDLARVELERAKLRAERVEARHHGGGGDSGTHEAVVNYEEMSDRQIAIKSSRALDRILSAGEARLAIEAEKLALFKTAVLWFKRAALVAGGVGSGAGGFGLFG